MLHTYWQADWRRHVSDLAFMAGFFVLLFVGLNLQSRAAWQWIFVAIGLTGSWGWYRNMRRYRTIADTPTSRIGSTPQGYAEFVGRGRHATDTPPRSRISGLPCLWHRYVIERERDQGWEYLESGESDAPFVVDDGSGRALIDPEGAEILVSHQQISMRADHRIVEWSLIEGELLYVIGEHVTVGGERATLDRRADVADVLSDWKRNPVALRARYDADRDGEISLDEWEKVRHDAAAEVDRAHRAARLEPDVHLMRRPADGRPFLIANRDVAALVRHFRTWSWIHLAWMAGAVTGLGWAARLP